MKLVVSGLVAIVTVIAGCDNALRNSIHRTSDLPEGAIARITLIDAKQRAILAKRVSIAPQGVEPDEMLAEGGYVICAEPSPDAVSSLSSAFEAVLGVATPAGDDADKVE